MVALKLTSFGGMLPALDSQLLPDTNAALSKNTWLYSGTLKGINTPTLLRSNTTANVSKVYRIPNSFGDNVQDSTWMEFDNLDTDIVRAPVVGDTYKRYYWASSSTAPRYNTTDRIKTALASYILGIPTPGSAPTLAATGGTSTVVIARAYSYTYISTYGEEGPPSPATNLTGKVDDTWTVTLPSTSGSSDLTDRSLAKRRIYRTITSSAGVATYFLVTEIAIGTNTYADTLSDTVVSANNQMNSTTWIAPPTDLKGFAAMPNGMIAGFRENELWFAEPYRPHAWPVQYVLAVEYPIVGLGVLGQTLVVCTQGFPTAATGINPSSISLSKLSAYEPCLSRGSIISSPEGVYYASQNGLVLVGGGTVQNITKELITKDRWKSIVSVPTLRAARLGTAYYAFGSKRDGVFDTVAFNTTGFTQQDYSGSLNGILIDPASQRVAFSTMSSDTPIANIINDPWSGEVFIVRDGKTYWLNVGDSNPIYSTYVWRSKIFQLAQRKNLGAIRVWFDIPPTSPVLNSVRNTALTQTVDADRYGVLRIYADDRLVATWELRASGDLIRPPSGYKAEFWQFEVEARVNVKSIQIGDTVEALKSV